MSSDRPAPPSIPPRNRTGAPAARPAGGRLPGQPDLPQPPPPSATPAPASGAGPVATQASATTPVATQASSAGGAARATGPRDSASPPAPAPAGGGVTTAVKRALKSASSAVVEASAAVTSELRGSTRSTTTEDDETSTSGSTKAAPTMTATETPAAAAPRARTATGASSARTGTATGNQATRSTTPTPAKDGAPRRVRLSVSRVDPWSVMKLSFLLSVAIGIMLVVAAAVVWMVLDGLAVFTEINTMITEIVGEESTISFLDYVQFDRVVSGAVVIAVVDVVLLTALSTIGAFLYNITAALVGGVTLTLTDE